MFSHVCDVCIFCASFRDDRRRVRVRPLTLGFVSDTPMILTARRRRASAAAAGSNLIRDLNERPKFSIYPQCDQINSNSLTHSLMKTMRCVWKLLTYISLSQSVPCFINPLINQLFSQ